MARREHLRQLKAFAEIREAQQRAADARLAEAQRGVAHQEARLSAEQERQADRGEAWAVSAAQGRIDLPLALAWSHALLEGEVTVTRAARAVRRAEDRRDGARVASREAEARREAIDDVVTQATRRARRRAEEASIADAEDLYAQRRAP